MIIRNPYDRDDLNIGKKDRVLEVGSGHNPTYRADVIVEQYIETNYHRCGNLKIYPHQDFINANGDLIIQEKQVKNGHKNTLPVVCRQGRRSVYL